MPGRRNPPAKWVLPTVINPPDHLCITIPVPNDRAHIAAFWGALYNLTSARFWADDTAHKALEVAEVWRKIYDQLAPSACDLICPVPIDEMEYIMSVCEQLRFQNGKLQGLCCGVWEDITGQTGITIGGPDQQGGGSPQPTPGGGCQVYHAKFDAKSQYLVPTVVNAGDTLTFSQVKGAGQDGSVSPWHCPDGSTFFGGLCVGMAGPSGSDPAPSLNHMAIVAKIGAVYYQAYGGAITVPGGIVNEQVTIQANDSTLGDNSGSYALDVEVCNNASPDWTHTINFALTDGGFTTVAHGGWTPSAWGTWTPGTGWAGTHSDNGGTHHHGVEISKSFTPTIIKTAILSWTLTKGSFLPGLTDSFYLVGSGTILVAVNQTAATETDGAKVYSIAPGAYLTDQITIALHDAYYTAGADGTSIVASLVLTGSGVDPF